MCINVSAVEIHSVRDGRPHSNLHCTTCMSDVCSLRKREAASECDLAKWVFLEIYALPAGGPVQRQRLDHSRYRGGPSYIVQNRESRGT